MQFKIGDRVKYIGRYSSFVSCNTVGVIVHSDVDGWDVLFSNSYKWFCMEHNLVKIPFKNQQLLFDFMDGG